MLPFYSRAAGMGVLRAAGGAWGDTEINIDLISIVSGSLDSSGSCDCVGSVSTFSPRCEKNDLQALGFWEGWESNCNLLMGVWSIEGKKP